MRRRRLLAALSLPILPCCAGGTELGDRSSLRAVSVDRIDRQPSEVDLELDVEVLRPEVTEEETALVELSLTSVGTERSDDLGFQQDGYANYFLSITRTSTGNAVSSSHRARWTVRTPRAPSPNWTG